MFSSGSADKAKPAPGHMPTDAIKCQGCGQVGTIDTGGEDEFGQHRRHGFYLHERGTTQVVACRKCQQIQG